MPIPKEFKFKKYLSQKIYEAKEINPGKGAYEIKSLTSPAEHFFCFDEEIEEYLKKRSWKIIEETVEPLNDIINKPSHYHKGGIDVIGFAELHFPKEQLKGFFRINSLKYLDRYEEKGGVEDLKKSRFYLDKLIALEEQHD